MNIKFRNMRTGDKIFEIVNHTLLTLILIVVLYPILYIIAASFSDPQAVISGEVFIFPVRPTLRGYEAVFKNKKILTGFANSVFYLVFGTALNIVMTLLCAYPLSRKEFQARNFLSMFFVFTMYFSGGLVPTYMVVKGLNLIDNRLAIIIPTAMSTYNMIICRTYMVNTIPDELYEAAEMDGATVWQRFRFITLPFVRVVVGLLIILRTIWIFNSFDLIFLLTGGGPGVSTQTMPIFAYRMGWTLYSLGRSSAVTILLLIILAVACTIYFKVLDHWESEVDQG